MAKVFREGTPQRTAAWDQLPLLTRPARRRLGRCGWFGIGIAAGLLIEALVR